MKNTLKIHRTTQQLTQQQLANVIGCSRQTINSIESGNYSPSLQFGLKLAAWCGVRVEELFQLEAADEVPPLVNKYQVKNLKNK